MPRYFFNLKGRHGVSSDTEGIELPDERSARGHACDVARELMRNRERQTGWWRIAACDVEGILCFELLFASVDPLLSELPPETRASIEDVCQKTASLNDTIHQVRRTLSQVRGTMARSDGAPYVIASDGVRL
jgi:hypothetical protein